jgi:nicotinamide mononucleotide (NMN) deamidase PncC
MTLFQEEFDKARLGLDSQIDYDVATLLYKGNATVSIAESITAGHIMSRFSSLPNYEQVVYGGIVCQHARSFMTFCGLSPASFTECSKKPHQLANIMLDKLLSQTKTTICISSAGFIEKKQEKIKSAKIYLGFLINDQRKIKSLEITGTVTTIYKQAAQATLAFLRHLLSSMENIDKKIVKEFNNG